MNITEIRVKSWEAEDALRRQEEYKKQCARICSELLAVNQKLGGGVVKSIPFKDGRGLLLRAMGDTIVDDARGSVPHVSFILTDKGIFDEIGVHPDIQYSRFFVYNSHEMGNLNFYLPFEGDMKMLQRAIDTSIRRALPNIPDGTSSISVKIK